jgi:hypothetical protein
MLLELSGGAGIEKLGSDEPNKIQQTLLTLVCDTAS